MMSSHEPGRPVTLDWKAEIERRIAATAVPASRIGAVTDELVDHLDDRFTALVHQGIDPDEARRRTLAELDEHALIVPPPRGQSPSASSAIVPGAPSRGSRLGEMARDVRFALRLLRRAPGFSAITVLTLALGIGANTTVFTIISTLFFNPFPVPEPDRLVSIEARNAGPQSSRQESQPISQPNLDDLRSARTGAFVGVSAHSAPMVFTYTRDGAPERVFAQLVTADYFDVLRLQPSVGRFFLADDDGAGAAAVTVLTHEAWTRRFASDPAVVGRTMTLNGVAFTVVGVAPPGFKGMEPVFGPDLWIPSMAAASVMPLRMRDWPTNRGAAAYRGIARLAPGISVEQADAAVRVVGASLAQQHPEANRGRTLTATPLTRAALMGAGSSGVTLILALWAIPVFVLLIACSNVANLLLSRSAARRQEMAVRLALGAGRARLIRQLVTESLVLAFVSGAIGLALAMGGVQLLWSFRPADVVANLVDLTISVWVFAFAAGISLVTGFVFGLAPAFAASKPDIIAAVKDGSRGATRGRRAGVKEALLVGQVALSLVSLVLAGLCVRSIQRAYAIDPGFETERLGVMLLSPGRAGYDAARSAQYYRDLERRLSAVPGVRQVAWASNLPLFSGPSRRVATESGVSADESTQALSVVNTVTPSYFDTAGIRLAAGRGFTARDDRASVPVAIVNQALASSYWPDTSPIGRRIRLSGDAVAREIVGIAANANYDALGEAPLPCVFLPMDQHFTDSAVLYVATTMDAATAMAAVQREVRVLDPKVEANDARTARTMVGQALFGATAGVGLLSTFGLMALALASLGLYGLVSYGVRLRERELAVRMALGATRGRVVAMVMREGLRLVSIGLVLGLGLSFFASRAASSLLYGVPPGDPVTLVGASGALLSIASLACLLPAWRAGRMEPLVALKG